jgi:hypothetical protein
MIQLDLGLGRFDGFSMPWPTWVESGKPRIIANFPNAGNTLGTGPAKSSELIHTLFLNVDKFLINYGLMGQRNQLSTADKYNNDNGTTPSEQ